MFLFSKIIEAAKLFKMQNQQYTERIPLSGTVPANGNLPFKANVSNLGHFLCLFITGHYETLASVTGGAGAKIIDDGICHLRMQIEDGGTGQRLLFTDYAPMDLFLSPGRIRSAKATNNLLDVALYANQADNAPQLYNAMENTYLFTANSDIICRIKNDSNTPINFDLLFYGILTKSQNSVIGLPKTK